MSYGIMKAVEFDKLPVKWKKLRQVQSANDLWREGWLAQPKYDGVYGRAIISDSEGDKMLTRTGEVVRSCDHILKELRSRHAGEYEVIGELWEPGVPFPTISGNVRRHKPSPSVMMVLNDYLPRGLTTDRPYAARLTDLQAIFGPEPWNLPCVTVADSIPFDGGIEAVARRLKAEGGFDGAILRDPRAGYTIGLVKAGEIVKVKPTLSLDLAVTAVFKDSGEKTGRGVYSIEVEYRGVRSKVGSGMPHDFDAVPMVGQIVEIEAMDITEDGKLREPRFKGIRFDKLEPDA